MFGSIARKFFGTVNDRILKDKYAKVDQINALEEGIVKLSDEQLRAKTKEFRARLEEGEALEAILPEAFAVVREASKRVLEMRHFDVQLIGGMILHEGMIAEMRTGEGKTLVATLPVYLNAVSGKGVHVVTVNDYLAQRDSQWMGKLYQFLGLTVGCVIHGLEDHERKVAYSADITYGTNNEFGFDYLRDNMKFSREEMVQRPFNFAIVDEVDSILIDEARTPLIISGPTEDSSELYYQVNDVIPKLNKEDYEVDEKHRSAVLTEVGTDHVEKILKESGMIDPKGSLYDIESISLVHHVNQALKAYKVFNKDKDYMVKDDQVMIIDEFTGRMMEGRRYSDGLHQALEAKEGVTVQNENQTLASITFQNYFRMFPKLAGMTGTAMTESAEFMDIYKLQVVSIPPNRIVTRKDEDDEIYRTAAEKYEAIIKQVDECHKSKQPVLVGTVSIEKSELLSKLLKKKKLPHHVLNAKHHEKEAHIIAQAGRPGAITIATNMAGRGTDIILGGNLEMLIEDAGDKADQRALEKQLEADKQTVIDAGGLFVLATERHESRRIDNQLRGRAGRQGDPGVSKFYLSLEDDLMRIFGSERIGVMLQRLGLEEGEAITHPWISRAIRKAQNKVESHNFDARKTLLKFDDVMNDQRKVIYDQRVELMESEEVTQTVKDMRDQVAENLVNDAIPPKSYHEEWDLEGLDKEIFRVYGLHLPVEDWAKEEGVGEEEILQKLDHSVDELFEKKEEKYGQKIMQLVEKKILLLTLDQLWKDHLLSLDHLRQGIGLRAYGQKDPLNEYKREAFVLFEHMLEQISDVVTTRLAHMELRQDQDQDAIEKAAKAKKSKTVESRAPVVGQEIEAVPVRTHIAPEDRDPADVSTWGKVGRNEPCPCGSGKKFKHCHGKLS